MGGGGRMQEPSRIPAAGLVALYSLAREESGQSHNAQRSGAGRRAAAAANASFTFWASRTGSGRGCRRYCLLHRIVPVRALSNCMRLADFIHANVEPILAEWESFARTIWPGGGKADPLALRDHAIDVLRATVSDM